MQAGHLGPLPLRLLRVTGEDRIDFLNRLLTQAVPDPGPQLSWAALCQAQGRVIGLFRIAVQPDAVALLVEDDLASRLREVFQRYILRSRIHLELGDPGWIAGGWLRPGQEGKSPPLPSGYSLLGVDSAGSPLPRYLALGPASELPSAKVPDPLWQRIDCWLGIPRILSVTSGQFVPHALHLAEIGAVSLRKGCYPGQEVIARTEYRGRVKRSLILLESPTVHSPGDQLTAGGLEEPAGTVLDCVPTAGSGTWIQAVVREEALGRVLSESGNRILRDFRPA